MVSKNFIKILIHIEPENLLLRAKLSGKQIFRFNFLMNKDVNSVNQ